MKLQVTQEVTTMAVPDGRGGWLNPAVDASSSPVTLFRYRTLDDAEFKSIVDYEDNSASPETLPYKNNAAETQQKQVNGTPTRGKEFWWPVHDGEEDDDSTLKTKKRGARPRRQEKNLVKHDDDSLTRHEKHVQRKERKLLRMEVEQKEKEAAYREELHNMQMAVFEAEKRAHEAKFNYYSVKMRTAQPHDNLLKMEATEPHDDLLNMGATEPHNDLLKMEATEPHDDLLKMEATEPHDNLRRKTLPLISRSC